MRYQIGEFSIISRLSIKTLRYYHECGLLEPSEVDHSSGYRFYDEESLGKARTIQELRGFDFSLKEIKEIVDSHIDGCELVDVLRKKVREITGKISGYREVKKRLERLIEREEEVSTDITDNEIIIKDIPIIRIASVRFTGKYQEVTPAFVRLLLSYGRYCDGVPFSLYYDDEYKEEKADIEACIPIKEVIENEGIKCRELDGGKAVTIIHRGPYETIGRSYKKLIDHIQENGYEIRLPNREVYLKGPDILVLDPPYGFITEVQMLLEE